MPRFFVPKENIDEATRIITLDREDANHLTVLRHSKGDAVTVCDGNGTDYECAICSITKNEAALNILHKSICATEPHFKVTLFQALPKADKMELIIQKCVELGVYEIVPVVTQNTVVRIKDNTRTKTARYQKISEAAAKQCNRGIIPNVSEPVDFLTAIEKLKKIEASYIAYEGEIQGENINLASITADDIGILIGPEGGFAEKEVDICTENGITPVSLGKRILRTETAGLAALAIIMYGR